MSNWFDTINQQTQPVFNAIVEHNFIKQLINGQLDSAIFQFYIEQDTLYLSVYKKLLAVIGTQCSDNMDCQFYLTSATGVLEVETALHNQYRTNSQAPLTASPSCELYTSYLAKMVYTQPLEVAMAAVLPCFTIYKAVGDYILAQPQVEGNPYQNWTNTYGGEAFAASTAQAIAITNRHAQGATPELLAQMNHAFVKASKLEWMFWDSAFSQQQWPI